MTRSQIRGSIAALMTPFAADGSVDHDSLTNLVNWQLASGSHGISIGGSTGEPSSQSIAERADAIRTVAAAVGDRVPFLPGTGTTKLDETLELTAAARDAGVDAALIITPYYARPTQEALYVWYKTVADEFPDLPIVAYNVPSRTAVDIAPETVARLFRDVDNFVGVKETTKDFEHFSRVLHLCGRDLMVWSGIELLCLPLLALGGAGFVSATANIAPAASAQLFEALGGRRPRARPRTALRAASAGRPAVRGDQPGARQVGARAARADRLRARAAAADPADGCRTGQDQEASGRGRAVPDPGRRLHRRDENHGRQLMHHVPEGLPEKIQHFIGGAVRRQRRAARPSTCSTR